MRSIEKQTESLVIEFINKTFLENKDIKRNSDNLGFTVNLTDNFKIKKEGLQIISSVDTVDGRDMTPLKDWVDNEIKQKIQPFFNQMLNLEILGKNLKLPNETFFIDRTATGEYIVTIISEKGDYAKVVHQNLEYDFTVDSSFSPVNKVAYELIKDEFAVAIKEFKDRNNFE
ncbi:hypothetical protein [Pedobacter sp. N23S346]|uniref:hypothetical protein n=1 Tax=Pedobacter sp. N23S346 TaxID=3402750 RepID=UPI003AD3F53B